MKKHINHYLTALLLLSLVSCFEDKGNYDYTDLESISITGINESNSIEARVQKLEINPVIKTNTNDEYTYVWELIKYSKTKMFKPDTLATTKNLSVFVNAEPGAYKLCFKAKNVNSGYEQTIVSNLDVITLYTRGWYVLKDNGTDSDIDFYPYSNESDYKPLLDKKRADILNAISGRNLKGKACRLHYLTAYYLRIKGEWVKSRCLLAASENDLIVAPVSTMEVTSTLDNISFKKLDNISFGFLAPGYTTTSMVYDGKLCGMNCSENNFGKFGAHEQIDGLRDQYRLSDYAFFEQIGLSGIVFDELSSTFLYVNSNGKLQSVTDDKDTKLASKNNNKTCIFMGRRKDKIYPDPADGYGIFADKTSGEKMIVYFPSSSMRNKFKVDITPILPNEETNTSSCFALSHDEQIMYMANGQGDVWSRNLANSSEKREFDVPSDEKVTFIRNHRMIEGKNENQRFNLIAIATEKGIGATASYTIRFFEKRAGSLASEVPLFTITGSGSAKDIFYVYDGIYSTGSNLDL